MLMSAMFLLRSQGTAPSRSFCTVSIAETLTCSHTELKAKCAQDNCPWKTPTSHNGGLFLDHFTAHLTSHLSSVTTPG